LLVKLEHGLLQLALLSFVRLKQRLDRAGVW
jgi:hypothetical protein